MGWGLREVMEGQEMRWAGDEVGAGVGAWVEGDGVRPLRGRGRLVDIGEWY